MSQIHATVLDRIPDRHSPRLVFTDAAPDKLSTRRVLILEDHVDLATLYEKAAEEHLDLAKLHKEAAADMKRPVDMIPAVASRRMSLRPGDTGMSSRFAPVLATKWPTAGPGARRPDAVSVSADCTSHDRSV